MSKIIGITIPIILGLHGLIHLIGTAVYMKLAEIQEFTYKTTLLGGRWDLGDKGMRIFGALWIIPTIGFIAVSVALFTGGEWWRSVLLAVTLFSLVLTILDWSETYAGAIINIVILVVLLLGPAIAAWFSR